MHLYVITITGKITGCKCNKCVYYSPHSQAMKIYPKEPHDGDETCLEFHMLSPDGAEERPSRVVCVHHERSWAWARVAVFSSHTMEWHILPAGPALRFRGPWSEPDQTIRYGLFRLNFFICNMIQKASSINAKI